MNPTQIESRIQTVCLLILTTIATATALYWLAPIMIPFVLAVFLAFGVAPFIQLLMRYLKVPRSLAVVATLLLGFVILNLVATLISTSLSQLAANADSYQQQFTLLVERASSALPLERYGIEPESFANPLSTIPTKTVGGMLVYVMSTLLNVVSKGFLVLVFLFFLLIGGQKVQRSVGGVWEEVGVRIQRYIVTKTIMSGATGIAVGGILGVLGIDLAMVFGFFAFILNFIPSIGSLVATLLPLPVILFSPDVTATTAVLAIALPAVVQLVIGNFIDPRVMGDSLDLHPVTILIALIFWGMIWGLVGMLLAVPLVAILKLLFERLEITAPLGNLLAGRLGTPVPD
jgi:AI-2 transport protein TqsA